MLEILLIFIIIVLHNQLIIQNLIQLLTLLLLRQISLQILFPQFLAYFTALIVLEFDVGTHHVLQQLRYFLIRGRDAVGEE